jgi:RNA polymerase sigma-70 factor (ECF subfamily)
MASENVNTTLLLKQLQLGSEQAFSKIYDLYSKPLYRNILYLVKDEDIAQEILQELFLKLWLKREHIDPERNWLSYMYETARRLVLMHFRKVAKDQRIINHVILTTVDYVMNAEDHIIDKETRALLLKAIESLPPQSKQVFKLCKLEGKSYQEAADLMGISRLTVRNQISTAKKSVKDFFLLNSDLAILLLATALSVLIQEISKTSLC